LLIFFFIKSHQQTARTDQLYFLAFFIAQSFLLNKFFFLSLKV